MTVIRLLTTQYRLTVDELLDLYVLACQEEGSRGVAVDLARYASARQWGPYSWPARHIARLTGADVHRLVRNRIYCLEECRDATDLFSPAVTNVDDGIALDTMQFLIKSHLRIRPIMASSGSGRSEQCYNNRCTRAEAYDRAAGDERCGTDITEESKKPPACPSRIA